MGKRIRSKSSLDSNRTGSDVSIRWTAAGWNSSAGAETFRSESSGLPLKDCSEISYCAAVHTAETPSKIEEKQADLDGHQDTAAAGFKLCSSYTVPVSNSTTAPSVSRKANTNMGSAGLHSGESDADEIDTERSRLDNNGCSEFSLGQAGANGSASLSSAIQVHAKSATLPGAATASLVLFRTEQGSMSYVLQAPSSSVVSAESLSADEGADDGQIGSADFRTVEPQVPAVAEQILISSQHDNHAATLQCSSVMTEFPSKSSPTSRQT